MKKLLSDPNDYADQAIDGLCLAYPDIYTRGGENGRVVYRTGGARQGKVASSPVAVPATCRCSPVTAATG